MSADYSNVNPVVRADEEMFGVLSKLMAHVSSVAIKRQAQTLKLDISAPEFQGPGSRVPLMVAIFKKKFPDVEPFIDTAEVNGPVPLPSSEDAPPAEPQAAATEPKPEPAPAAEPAPPPKKVPAKSKAKAKAAPTVAKKRTTKTKTNTKTNGTAPKGRLNFVDDEDENSEKDTPEGAPPVAAAPAPQPSPVATPAAPDSRIDELIEYMARVDAKMTHLSEQNDRIVEALASLDPILNIVVASVQNGLQRLGKEWNISKVMGNLFDKITETYLPATEDQPEPEEEAEETPT
jgi:pyruvate/2-oxoglutarate dehydrogenase complex dihydrolipoamide acyltransferase (E2) component